MLTHSLLANLICIRFKRFYAHCKRFKDFVFKLSKCTSKSWMETQLDSFSDDVTWCDMNYVQYMTFFMFGYILSGRRSRKIFIYFLITPRPSACLHIYSWSYVANLVVTVLNEKVCVWEAGLTVQICEVPSAAGRPQQWKCLARHVKDQHCCTCPFVFEMKHGTVKGGSSCKTIFEHARALKQSAVHENQRERCSRDSLPLVCIWPQSSWLLDLHVNVDELSMHGRSSSSYRTRYSEYSGEPKWETFLCSVGARKISS